jgi:plastocyanin
MSGMSFSPASKTVAKGSVVKWTNNDSYAHTVTSNDGTTFDSGNIAGNGTYSYTADTAGTFNYHCTIHGMVMSGTLIVTP